MDQKESAELVLTYLYDCAEDHGHTYYFFRLNEFARSIGIHDTEELIYIVNALESHGFVMLTATNPGEISAMITVDGCSLVEEGGETGVIGRYRADPESFGLPVPSKEDKLSTDVQRIMLGNQVHGILMDISETLEKQTSMGAEERAIIFKDLTLLTDQLGAFAVDSEFLDHLLKRLLAIEGLSEMTGELGRLIRAYMGGKDMIFVQESADIIESL